MEYNPMVNVVSIHALREESDSHAPVFHGIVLTFQSTLSVRRAIRSRFA